MPKFKVYVSRRCLKATEVVVDAVDSAAASASCKANADSLLCHTEEDVEYSANVTYQVPEYRVRYNSDELGTMKSKPLSEEEARARAAELIQRPGMIFVEIVKA